MKTFVKESHKEHLSCALIRNTMNVNSKREIDKFSNMLSLGLGSYVVFFESHLIIGKKTLLWMVTDLVKILCENIYYVSKGFMTIVGLQELMDSPFQ